MRAKNTIVSSLLCALMVLIFASSAQAIVTYQVQTSPLNAIRNGVAEVMGDVVLSVAAAPPPGVITNNDQITVTFSQAAIANTGATGITVIGTGTLAGQFTFGVVPNVGGIGGQVTITFTNAAVFVPAVNDTITIKGVRASVVGRPIAGIVITQFTAAPAGSSSFIVTSSPTVAFVVDNFSISGNGNITVPICQPSSAPNFTFTVKEESLTTWINYTVPTNGRSVPPYVAGGNANSAVHLHVVGLPTGVTITWPASATSNVDVDNITAGFQPSVMTLTSQSTSGDDAVYNFSTPSQAGSDNVIESFTVSLSFGGNISVGLATPPGSITLLEAQEYPPDTAITSMPRFSDPYRTAIAFATYVDCVTNLLFPWVGSLPDFGYDTGIAIANTGYDVGAITPPTVGDPGVIRLYFYPQTFGAAPVAPTPVTTSVIVAGDTWAAPFSSVGASKFGYLIAVCEFRFGHGFAYITQGTIGGTLDTAQGYLALVLNQSNSPSTTRFYPETLGQ